MRMMTTNEWYDECRKLRDFYVKKYPHPIVAHYNSKSLMLPHVRLSVNGPDANAYAPTDGRPLLKASSLYSKYVRELSNPKSAEVLLENLAQRIATALYGLEIVSIPNRWRDTPPLQRKVSGAEQLGDLIIVAPTLEEARVFSGIIDLTVRIFCIGADDMERGYCRPAINFPTADSMLAQFKKFAPTSFENMLEKKIGLFVAPGSEEDISRYIADTYGDERITYMVHGDQNAHKALQTAIPAIKIVAPPKKKSPSDVAREMIETLNDKVILSVSGNIFDPKNDQFAQIAGHAMKLGQVAAIVGDNAELLYSIDDPSGEMVIAQKLIAFLDDVEFGLAVPPSRSSWSHIDAASAEGAFAASLLIGKVGKAVGREGKTNYMDGLKAQDYKALSSLTGRTLADIHRLAQSVDGLKILKNAGLSFGARTLFSNQRAVAKAQKEYESHKQYLDKLDCQIVLGTELPGFASVKARYAFVRGNIDQLRRMKRDGVVAFVGNEDTYEWQIEKGRALAEAIQYAGYGVAYVKGIGLERQNPLLGPVLEYQVSTLGKSLFQHELTFESEEVPSELTAIIKETDRIYTIGRHEIETDQSLDVCYLSVQERKGEIPVVISTMSNSLPGLDGERRVQELLKAEAENFERDQFDSSVTVEFTPKVQSKSLVAHHRVGTYRISSSAHNTKAILSFTPAERTNGSSEGQVIESIDICSKPGSEEEKKEKQEIAKALQVQANLHVNMITGRTVSIRRDEEFIKNGGVQVFWERDQLYVDDSRSQNIAPVFSGKNFATKALAALGLTGEVTVVTQISLGDSIASRALEQAALNKIVARRPILCLRVERGDTKSRNAEGGKELTVVSLDNLHTSMGFKANLERFVGQKESIAKLASKDMSKNAKAIVEVLEKFKKSRVARGK